MSEKKMGLKNWILDIVSLPVLIYQTVLTSITIFKKAGNDIVALNEQEDTKAEKRYQDMASKFTDETRAAWRNYTYTGLILQVLIAIFGVGHALIGNWITALQIVIVFCAIYVCFGYRVWVLRHKKMISFVKYIKCVARNPLDASLINSTSLMDK